MPANTRFLITNQLLYQLSYAGIYEGKYPDASSANRFLYTFSIRLSLTLLKGSFWARSERTRGYSHHFSASAIRDRLRLGAVTVFVRAIINGCEGRYECVRRKVWQTTAIQNLVRYRPSGTYFARFRVGGKLVWKSLETVTFSVGKAATAQHTAILSGQRCSSLNPFLPAQFG